MKVSDHNILYKPRANQHQASRIRAERSRGETVSLFLASKYLKATSQLSCSVPDGKVCLNETGELAVTKFAVEPVRCGLCLS
jgi:hypothetical protein